jgi:hypothetical protein
LPCDWKRFGEGGEAMSAGGAAAANAIIQATRASGVIVNVEPEAFELIVKRQTAPLVVRAPVKVLWYDRGTRYLTAHKGLAFTTKTQHWLQFPSDTEFVDARGIWVP